MSGKAVTAVLAGLSVACLLVMAILFSVGVEAQSCMPIGKVLAEIAGPRFSEGPAFKGVVKGPDGKPVAMMGFANPKTGTFTIFLRPSADMACPVMDGSEFELIEPDPPKPGTGS